MKSNTSFKFNYWLALMPGIVICLISARPVTLQEKYIEQFKGLAISEMERTGIPASIKLAQGLLESQSGRSELAKYANNHFGIKCKNDWTGEIYYYHDDDKNTDGEIIASCFRSYSSPSDSYKDHSDFLVNRSRYKELFNLPKTDYVSWAQGLKKCGYATDPNYADRLIKTIQKYNLDNLDAKTELANSKDALWKDSIAERVVFQPFEPIEPISPKQVNLIATKNIPNEYVKLSHKSKQKHKRKRRN